MLYVSQDSLATIPHYHHYIGDSGADYDVATSISDPDSMWIVRPQLFFSCTLRPLNANKRDCYNSCQENIPLDLVFFSACEDLRLLAQWSQMALGSCMNPLLPPTLYVGRVEDLLGRVPLFQCFLDGNATFTIQYKYAARQKQAFTLGCAYCQGPASRRGIHVYEINN